MSDLDMTLSNVDMIRYPELKTAVTKLEAEMNIERKRWRRDCNDYPLPSTLFFNRYGTADMARRCRLA